MLELGTNTGVKAGREEAGWRTLDRANTAGVKTQRRELWEVQASSSRQEMAGEDVGEVSGDCIVEHGEGLPHECHRHVIRAECVQKWNWVCYYTWGLRKAILEMMTPVLSGGCRLGSGWGQQLSPVWKWGWDLGQLGEWVCLLKTQPHSTFANIYLP